MLIPRTVTGALLALAAWSSAGVAQAADIGITSCTLGTFQVALASAADGDTLRFACDGTIPLESDPITINKSLTLDATGHTVTISGRGPERVFFISTPPIAEVTLRGLTIRNGQNPDDVTPGGGGIYHSSGTLTLEHVRMVGNHAQRQGGAVRSAGNAARLVVRDSVFDDNSVSCGSVCGADGGGGAIMAAGVRGALIERSLFRGNETVGLGSGGAIWTPLVFNAALQPVVIRDNVFEDNRATSVFLDATRPSRGGGAIGNVDRETTIERNVFRRNVSRPYGSSAVQIEGGAIRMAGQGDPVFPGKPATITDNVFEDNAAFGEGARGGAISVSKRTVTISGMRAVGNRSSSVGGVVAATLATVAVRDALLSGNTAAGDPGLPGFVGSAFAAIGSAFTLAGVDVAGGEGAACSTVDVGPDPGVVVDDGDSFEAPGATCGFASVARPTLTAGTATVRAPRDGTASVVDVPVTLSAPLPYALRVGWSRADGASGAVEIPAGALTADVPVIVRGSAPVEATLTLPEGGRTQLAGDGVVRVAIAPEPVVAATGPGPGPAALPAAPSSTPAATPAATARGCRGTRRITYRPGGGQTVLSAFRLTRAGAAKPVLFTRTRVVVDLRNLRPGTYAVRVKLRTKAGRTRTLTKRYAVCAGS